MTKFSVDLTDDSPEGVDTGGRVPAGWYRAFVHDVVDDVKSGKTMIAFRITAGSQKDATVYERLSDPDLVESEKGKRVSLTRIKLFASRLGLIKADAFGRQADGDFVDAIGTECVIQVVHRPYPDKTTGAPQVSVELDFAGIYPLDHAKIPADVRKALGLPPLPSPLFDAAESGAKPATPGQKKAAAIAAAAHAPTSIDVSDL